MNIIPLKTRLSSTRGLLWDFGKKGFQLGHLCVDQPVNIAHDTAPFSEPWIMQRSENQCILPLNYKRPRVSLIVTARLLPQMCEK